MCTPDTLVVNLCAVLVEVTAPGLVTANRIDPPPGQKRALWGSWDEARVCRQQHYCPWDMGSGCPRSRPPSPSPSPWFPSTQQPLGRRSGCLITCSKDRPLFGRRDQEELDWEQEVVILPASCPASQWWDRGFWFLSAWSGTQALVSSWAGLGWVWFSGAFSPLGLCPDFQERGFQDTPLICVHWGPHSCCRHYFLGSLSSAQIAADAQVWGAGRGSAVFTACSSHRRAHQTL